MRARSGDVANDLKLAIDVAQDEFMTRIIDKADKASDNFLILTTNEGQKFMVQITYMIEEG
ncbi:hypothetical protein [Actinomadura rubrisoli]|uniref:Uncharacterized protein n=1 Tax=Actinomadura rubrisoli TaxID=2530368 RepID=A0A4R5CB96_9ACTN|nr:hypothetical protein [Actinomadura rubrisoli]TDD97218.1 hypothetical protein E1298_01925 [Actinomadura rubrisoli]